MYVKSRQGQPNAAYIYKANELPFEPYSREYTGTGSDLKHGYRGECAARFMHMHGWQTTANRELQRLGIYPDQPRKPARGGSVPRVDITEWVPRTNGNERQTGSGSNGGSTLFSHTHGVAGSTPKGANFTMPSLRALAAKHAGVVVDERRGTSGGRLWVEDPKQRIEFGNELKRLGFRWARGREAWYYPES